VFFGEGVRTTGKSFQHPDPALTSPQWHHSNGLEVQLTAYVSIDVKIAGCIIATHDSASTQTLPGNSGVQIEQITELRSDLTASADTDHGAASGHCDGRSVCSGQSMCGNRNCAQNGIGFLSAAGYHAAQFGENDLSGAGAV
jgi:hypothetical protein